MIFTEKPAFLLQDGAIEVGVSLLYTEKEMDAGPIIAQQAVTIDGGIQADELLFHLFAKGTRYSPHSSRLSTAGWTCNHTLLSVFVTGNPLLGVSHQQSQAILML